MVFLFYVNWQEISGPEISCRFQSILTGECEVWASVSGADLSWGPIRIDLFYIQLYILHMYPRSWSEVVADRKSSAVGSLSMPGSLENCSHGSEGSSKAL